MIEIKVTVELPGIPEALAQLADALAQTHRPDVKNEVAPTRKRKPAKDKAEDPKPAEAKAEEPPAPTPAADAVRAGVPEPATVTKTDAEAEDTPAKAYTLEQISKAGLELMDAGRLTDLMGLLAKYGLQSLTAADPKQYTAIAEDLIAMGGTIPEVG